MARKPTGREATPHTPRQASARIPFLYSPVPLGTFRYLAGSVTHSALVLYCLGYEICYGEPLSQGLPAREFLDDSTQAELAGVMHITERGLRQAWQELEDAGVGESQRHGRRVRYRFLHGIDFSTLPQRQPKQLERKPAAPVGAPAIAVDLDCPHGLTCPVQSLSERSDGVLTNIVEQAQTGTPVPVRGNGKPAQTGTPVPVCAPTVPIQPAAAAVSVYLQTLTNHLYSPVPAGLADRVAAALRGAPVERLRSRVELRKLALKSWGLLPQLAQDVGEVWATEQIETRAAGDAATRRNAVECDRVRDELAADVRAGKLSRAEVLWHIRKGFYAELHAEWTGQFAFTAEEVGNG
jgi:hypothetical protein